MRVKGPGGTLRVTVGPGRRRSGMRAVGLSVAVAALAAFALAAPGTAGATTITVNAITDAAANDNVCTLREAITAANTNSPSADTMNGCLAGQASPTVDTINFSQAIVDDPDASDRTINLTAALTSMSEVVDIEGCALATAQPPTQPCVG